MNSANVLHSGDVVLLKFRKDDDRLKCFVTCDGIVDGNISLLCTLDASSAPPVGGGRDS